MKRMIDENRHYNQEFGSIFTVNEIMIHLLRYASLNLIAALEGVSHGLTERMERLLCAHHIRNASVTTVASLCRLSMASHVSPLIERICASITSLRIHDIASEENASVWLQLKHRKAMSHLETYIIVLEKPSDIDPLLNTFSFSNSHLVVYHRSSHPRDAILVANQIAGHLFSHSKSVASLKVVCDAGHYKFDNLPIYTLS